MQLPVISRLGLACALLCLNFQPDVIAQAKTGTGTISGRVTIGDKPARGVAVLLLPAQQNELLSQRHRAQAKTDAEGRYRLTGLPAGSFKIAAAAREYVYAGDDWRSFPPGRSVILGEGEQLEDQDLTLVRGGVITGRVTDATGKPLIEETVKLFRFDERGRRAPYYQPFAPLLKTDDRGSYRVYGLPAGRYLVAAGFGEGDDTARYNTGQRRAYKLTYHPDANDETKAKVIEVTLGSEAEDVDIKLGASSRGHMVSVRVVEAETGRPLPNLQVAYASAPRGSAMTPAGRGASATNNQGEVRFESVLPGRYVAYLISYASDSEFYGESQPFEVTETGPERIELQARRGASVSGVVAFEGVNAPALLAKAKTMRLHLIAQGHSTAQLLYSDTLSPPNLSFRISGVPPGKYRLFANGTAELRGLAIARIEHKGVALRGDFELSEGQQLNGLRVVLVYGNAVVRGQVQVIGGNLPAQARLSISAVSKDNPLVANKSVEADARGHFVLEYLSAGTYELSLFASAPRTTPGVETRAGARVLLRPPIKQQVVVSNEGETQVVLTLDLTEGRR
jgi:protocatechuate 3,4-dioxygenase beta subunit